MDTTTRTTAITTTRPAARRRALRSARPAARPLVRLSGASNIIAIPAAIATTSTSTVVRSTTTTLAASSADYELGGAEDTFRLVQHVKLPVSNGEVAAVKRELPGFFAFCDEGEGAE